jgi:ferredoxin-type protein NapG
VEEVREAAQAAMPDEPEERSGRSFHRSRRRSAALNRDYAALIRPPGAIPDPAFYEACSRCHHCVEACPEGVIFTAGPEHGPHQEFTPVLFLDQKACILCADVPCAKSCPSGALEAIPLSELRLGVLELAEELCLNSQGEECSRCMDACPIEGKAIKVELGSLPAIDRDRCTACGQCVVACVSHPKALAVVAR